MLTQTLTIFLDAYRELNAKRLFWITLAISGLVVIVFAAVGISERGLSIFGVFLGPWINTSMVPRDVFYKYIFAMIGVPIWLTWVSTILALVSTAGMIPDFVTGGAIDVLLSKPIGRLRLFLTKYASALTFAGLQSLVFSAAVFLVIGVRGHSWEPMVFLAVPLVLCFFSFIYCVCALVGLLTRSTIASLLAAAGFWLLIFACHSTESIYLMVRVNTEQQVRSLEALQTSLQQDLTALDAPAPAPGAAQEPHDAPAIAEPVPPPQGFRAALAEAVRQATSAGETDARKRDDLEKRLAKTTAKLESERKDLRLYRKGHGIVMGIKTVLPKTSETMQLLSRSLLSAADIAGMQPQVDNPPRHNRRGADADEMMMMTENERKAGEEIQRIIRARSVWWVLGTSLLFEALVVGVSATIFCRRDF